MSEVVEVPGGSVGREDVDRASVIERVARHLREGRLVVLPTDTVYGIAADAFDPDATARLRRVRGQPASSPLTVLVRSPKQLLGFTEEVPAAADRVIAAFWPGPLTIVLAAEPGMRWDLGHTAGTLALRMPLDDAAIDLVRAVGPLAVSSACVVGGTLPHTVEVAREQLGEAVACYLDDGTRDGGARSTIIDLHAAQPRILRSGAIDDGLVLGVARGDIDPLQAAVEASAPPSDGDRPGHPDGDGREAER